jgi:hypothetical protein
VTVKELDREPAAPAPRTASVAPVLAAAVGNRSRGALLARSARAERRRVIGRCACGRVTVAGGSCTECRGGPAGENGQAALRRTVAARAQERRLARLVGTVGCTAGVASAPADPATELEDIDRQAHDMAAELSADLAADSATVRAGGVPATPSGALQSYLDHFGLPTAAGRGFLNRITGIVRSTQDVATAEELHILSRRYALIARLLRDRLVYRCGAGRINVGGCQDDCSTNDFDAFTCRAAPGIGMCPSFWTGYADNTARAAIVIHELFHTIFGVSNPRNIGEIGDETQRGPGRNFNVAGCYEFLVDDVFGTDSGAACPAIP